MLELERRSPPETKVRAGNRTHEYLAALEQKVLWLACWTIHHANHVRASRDGLKVGGHQASCASIATLMSALYFDVLGPGDRVAVKPHASPVYHAIQYLLGRQTQDKLARFRAFGGAQAYPSRTKDSGGVDFSTGSVGLGAAMTLFASLAQDVLHERRLLPEGRPKQRMIALVGDAELDEGNVFEALLEGWKHDIRNVWWVIDYNRQSLDRVVPERLFTKIEDFFWRGRLGGRDPQVRQAAAGGVRAARRHGAAPVDRRLPERSVLGAHLQGRRRVAPAPRAGPRPAPGHPHAARRARRRRARAPDDQSRRPRSRAGARGVPGGATTTGRAASSPTPSRASGCRSRATRTTTPG